MKYETEIISGHSVVVRHMFKEKEIKIGSNWISSSGNIVTVEEVIPYDDKQGIQIVYSWEENGERKTHSKESFSFQCRYCLIIA
jgi:hypothetical protein